MFILIKKENKAFDGYNNYKFEIRTLVVTQDHSFGFKLDFLIVYARLVPEEKQVLRHPPYFGI